MHFINRLDPKTVELLERAPGIKIYDVPGAGHYTFPMRGDTPPFDNNDLRLALKYAINREEIVKKILRGYGKLGNDHPVPEFDPFYAADIPQRPYDPDKAKFHISSRASAGRSRCSSRMPRSPARSTPRRCTSEHRQGRGIDLDVQRVPEDGYWSEPGCRSRSAAPTGAAGRPPT